VSGNRIVDYSSGTGMLIRNMSINRVVIAMDAGWVLLCCC